MADRVRPSAFHSIIVGGLAVGVLDCIAAMVSAAIRGVTPDRVWQYVASAVLGPESFSGGAATVVLGLLFHFCVAGGVATGFYVVCRLFPVLIPFAIPAGILYGVFVYFAMSYVIVPLTAAQQGAFSWKGLISQLIIHMFFVGLPLALITKRYPR